MRRVIKGEQLFAFVDDRAIGASTDCSVSLVCDAVEVCSRGGSARRFREGKMSWSVQCSGFVRLGGTLYLGQPIRLAISVLGASRVAKGVDIETLSPSGEATLFGDAIITDFRGSGSKGSVATYEMTLQGTGEIMVEVKDVKGFPYVFPISLA